jgi:predicted transcriptional regulator
MKSLKNESLAAISALPEDSSVDEIMYRVYVIDKIQKGLEAADNGKTLTIEEMEKDISSW